MTKDEALSLALDWFICYQDKSMSRNNAEALTDEIITAIKEALAQRTWVGLTDEEIEKHWKKQVGTVRPNYSFTRAIESKLKEKNEFC